MCVCVDVDVTLCCWVVCVFPFFFIFLSVRWNFQVGDLYYFFVWRATKKMVTSHGFKFKIKKMMSEKTDIVCMRK